MRDHDLMDTNDKQMKFNDEDRMTTSSAVKIIMDAADRRARKVNTYFYTLDILPIQSIFSCIRETILTRFS